MKLRSSIKLRSFSLWTFASTALMLVGACGSMPDEQVETAASALKCGAGEKEACEFDQETKKRICECVPGLKCAAGTVQVGAACVACGKIGQPVCDVGRACEPGAEEHVGTCYSCGTLGTAPCRLDGCASGLYSSAGVCDTLRGAKHDLLWQNVSTGELGTWHLDGATVTGTMSLSAHAYPAPMKVVGTQDNEVDWLDMQTGAKTRWTIGPDGTAYVAPAVTFAPCTFASGCATGWNPIGWDLWHNPSTGDLSFWNTYDQTANPLSWRCGASGGCSSTWRPILVGSLTQVGARGPERARYEWRDILWHNPSTGDLSVWKLDDKTSTTVTGPVPLSWKCDAASGCARDWKVVDAIDVNGDGYGDLTWHNAATGELSTWLLGGDGNVLGVASMSWRCGASGGCAETWKPLGYLTFLPPLTPTPPPVPTTPPPVPTTPPPVPTTPNICSAPKPTECGSCRTAGDYIVRRTQDNLAQCSTDGSMYVVTCATPISSCKLLSACDGCPNGYHAISSSNDPNSCASGSQTMVVCQK